MSQKQRDPNEPCNYCMAPAGEDCSPQPASGKWKLLHWQFQPEELADVCPAYEDGRHCFVPSDVRVNPDNGMDIRSTAKTCACGTTVKRVAKPEGAP